MDMAELVIKIKCHYPGMKLPEKAHVNDSGLDLTLMKIEEKRNNIIFFDTGVSIEPPSGYYTELYPRSSIYKSDFIMTNSVGIIDEGYRGILYMPMRYVGMGYARQAAEKLIGQRVGQLVLKKMVPFQIDVVDMLTDSERGGKGFGSSGS